MRLYAVIAGNVGKVWEGSNARKARREFRDYVQASKGRGNRVSGEPIALLCDGNPVEDYDPPAPLTNPDKDLGATEIGEIANAFADAGLAPSSAGDALPDVEGLTLAKARQLLADVQAILYIGG